MMNVNEYLEATATYVTLRDGSLYRSHNPHVVCKDGFTMSVQARKGCYCIPESDTGPYTHVEVGYPSIHPRKFAPYGSREESIYARVPVEIVDAVIAQHGGIANK
jgi:hypothetical protein